MRQVKMTDLDTYDLFVLNLPCEGCEEICDDCPKNNGDTETNQ